MSCSASKAPTGQRWRALCLPIGPHFPFWQWHKNTHAKRLFLTLLLGCYLFPHLSANAASLDFRNPISIPIEKPLLESQGDFNNDGLVDLVVRSNYADYFFFPGTESEGFDTPVSFRLDDGAHNASSDDFNQDKALDLISESKISDHCRIQLAAGNNDFTLQDTILVWEVWCNPLENIVALLSVDVNNDDFPDIIFTTSASFGGESSVFAMLSDAAGSLRDPINVTPDGLPFGQFPANPITGDANEDGNVDLIYSRTDWESSTTSAVVRFGNGAGGFPILMTRDVSSAVDLAASRLLDVGILLGDFTGDSIMDLVVVGDLAILVYLGNPDGTLSLQPLVSPSLPGTVLNTGGSPLPLASGDINGDRRLDIVTLVKGETNAFAVYLGIGNGRFLDAVTYALPFNPSSLQVGRFDSDLKPDVAVAAEDGNAVLVFHNDSDGGGLIVVPSSGGDTGATTVTISSHFIQEQAKVVLKREGHADIVGTNSSQSIDGVVITTLPLEGAELGEWDVYIENPDGEAVLEKGRFRIEKSTGAQLWAEIVAPEAIRAGRASKVTIAYGNTGNVDARFAWLGIGLPFEVEYNIPVPNAWPPAPYANSEGPSDTTRLELLNLPPLAPNSLELITLEILQERLGSLQVRALITADAMPFVESELALAEKVAPALDDVDPQLLPSVIDPCPNYQHEIYDPTADPKVLIPGSINVFPAGTMFHWQGIPGNRLDDGQGNGFGWHVAKSIGCGQFIDMLTDGDPDGGINIRTLDENWLRQQGTMSHLPALADSPAHRTEVRESAIKLYKVFGETDRDRYTYELCKSDFDPVDGITTNCLGLFHILNPELSQLNLPFFELIHETFGHEAVGVFKRVFTRLQADLADDGKCEKAWNELESGTSKYISVVGSLDPNDKYGQEGTDAERYVAIVLPITPIGSPLCA